MVTVSESTYEDFKAAEAELRTMKSIFDSSERYLSSEKAQEDPQWGAINKSRLEIMKRIRPQVMAQFEERVNSFLKDGAKKESGEKPDKKK